MQINHRAFLDLENSLTSKLVGGWKSVWDPISKELRTAILNKNWHRADKLIDLLNTDPLVKVYAQHAQTVGLSAMLLGASRLTDIGDSKIVEDPPLRQLSNGVTQWGFWVSRNGPQLLRRKLHVQLAALEHAQEQARHVIQKGAGDDLVDQVNDMFSGIGLDARNFMSLASSLMVSRMSSFGFLVEAQARGIREYEISAVLDDRTCPVCEVMDGKVFDTSAGVAQAASIMDAEDPDSLASISPWPSQSKDSIGRLEESSSQELVDSGLALPPYHPGCRCITVGVDDQTDSASSGAAEVQADDLDLPSVSLGTLEAILGITLGDLTPARKHKNAQLVGEQDEEDEEEEDLENETEEQRKKRLKQDNLTNAS